MDGSAQIPAAFAGIPASAARKGEAVQWNTLLLFVGLSSPIVLPLRSKRVHVCIFTHIRTYTHICISIYINRYLHTYTYRQFFSQGSRKSLEGGLEGLPPLLPAARAAEPAPERAEGARGGGGGLAPVSEVAGLFLEGSYIVWYDVISQNTCFLECTVQYESAFVYIYTYTYTYVCFV